MPILNIDLFDKKTAVIIALNELKCLVESGEYLKSMELYNFGICWGIDYIARKMNMERDIVHGVICEYYERWPMYSLDISYPVPCPKEEYGGCPARAYTYTDDMYDADTAYGRARRDLLNFLIESIDRELAQECGIHYNHKEGRFIDIRGMVW